MVYLLVNLLINPKITRNYNISTLQLISKTGRPIRNHPRHVSIKNY